MTIYEAQTKLIKTAEAEAGYLEKATNAQLDSKTANAGYNNYTKYARDHATWGTYQSPKQGLPWCDMFVDWCFITTFGFNLGMKLTCQPKGGYGAGCTESYNYYKAAGQTVPVSQAQTGDQIFFGAPGNMTHTGLVTKVDSQYIYTIEGNTGSGDNTVIANGGGVFQKKYTRGYAKIGGFGRPRWNLISGSSSPAATTTAPNQPASAVYRESTYLGGIFLEIPFSCIAHAEHVKMNASRGETIDSVMKRAKWNGKAPSVVVNAELYTLKDMSPASGVKHHGVMERAGWQPGIGFKNSKTPVWQPYNSVTTEDWVGGYPAVIQNGVKDFKVPAGLGNASYRTMMGIKGQKLGIIVTRMGCSIDAVASKFAADGYTDVINLDGGASSCYVTPERKWSRQKPLRGYIAIWLTGDSGNTSQTTPAQSVAPMQHDSKYKNGKTFKVTASALNMRGQNGAVMTTLKNGTSCTWYGYYTTKLPGMSGKFLWVVANGKTGYVSAQYVK